MNLINLINNKYESFSEKEKSIAQYIKVHMQDIHKSSVKQLAHDNNTSVATISRFFKKLGLNGFKDMRIELSRINSDYVANLTELAVKYKQTLLEDLLFTINDIDLVQLNNCIEDLDKNKPILIFATGNTQILSQFFYFSLNTLGYNCELISSLYNLKVLDVDNKIIFIITMSGKNIKINRYLQMIKNRNPFKIVGISSNKTFINSEILDYHFYGYSTAITSINSRAIPMNEKYVILILLDIITLKLYEKNRIKIDSFINSVKSIDI